MGRLILYPFRLGLKNIKDIGKIFAKKKIIGDKIVWVSVTMLAWYGSKNKNKIKYIALIIKENITLKSFLKISIKMSTIKNAGSDIEMVLEIKIENMPI